MTRIQITENSWLDILNFSYELRDANLFPVLWRLKPADKGKIVIYGKETDTPRYFQSYDKGYFFSGSKHDAIPLPDCLFEIKKWADNLGYGSFDQTLINWYVNGHDYIGSHSDDEKQLKSQSPILALSLGETRKFRLRTKDGKIVKDIFLDNYSVVVMGGAFQNELKHEIVKIAGQKGANTGPRISITFRQFENNV